MRGFLAEEIAEGQEILVDRRPRLVTGSYTDPSGDIVLTLDRGDVCGYARTARVVRHRFTGDTPTGPLGLAGSGAG